MQFGTAIEKDLSPSIDVLHDLQTKGLPFDALWTCLEKIGCQRALNVFQAASEYIWCACMHVCALLDQSRILYPTPVCELNIYANKKEVELIMLTS